MRLIDADALKARIIEDVPGFLDGGSTITKAFILAMLGTRNATPTIDAVPVVRCKDCIYCVKEPNGDLYCDILAIGYEPFGSKKVTENWYCADGERKYQDEKVY